MRALGEEIRRRRVALGVGETELARRAEIHRNYLHSVEAGERNISVSNLKRIADALGVDISELVSAAFETKPEDATGTTNGASDGQ